MHIHVSLEIVNTQLGLETIIYLIILILVYLQHSVVILRWLYIGRKTIVREFFYMPKFCIRKAILGFCAFFNVHMSNK
jgi:hypothetical protein